MKRLFLEARILMCRIFLNFTTALVLRNTHKTETFEDRELVTFFKSRMKYAVIRDGLSTLFPRFSILLLLNLQNALVAFLKCSQISCNSESPTKCLQTKSQAADVYARFRCCSYYEKSYNKKVVHDISNTRGTAKNQYL